MRESAAPSRATWHSLLLLLTPSVLLLVAPALVLAATEQETESALPVMAGLIASLPLLTPLLLRLVGRSWDPHLMAPAWVLCALGLAVIARVQPDLLATQMLWIGAGWSAFITLTGFPLTLPWLYRFRFWLLGAGLGLVVLTLLLGEDVTGEGARLWLTFGPFRMQPAELLRVLLVAFIAGHLAAHTERTATAERPVMLRSLSHDWFPLLAMVGLAVLAVIAQRDMGAAIIFGASAVALLYLATGRKEYMLGAVVVGILAVIVIYAGSARIQERVDVWIDPWGDPRGQGYQPLQALGAFVFGGVFGTGPGYGYPGLIPAAHTDYPLAVIGEEWGLLGSLAVVALYGLLTVHGIARAQGGGSAFAQLLRAGLSISLAAQVLLVFAGVLRLLPLTGLTSPFMSYGGSSMIMSWVMLALLTATDDSPSRRGVSLPSPSEIAASIAPRARLLGLATLAGFASLALGLGYWHVARVDLVNDPAVVGERLRSEEERVQRGRILDRHGRVLAETEIGSNGGPRRVYAAEGAAHVLGFTSAQVGAGGVEAAAADTLMGRTAPTPRDTWLDLLHEARTGEDVQITIDLDIQRAAEQALGGGAGAVIALDARTGDVLASVSSPTFDPNFTTEEWDHLRDAEGSPLLNRATQGLYTPGSTFKTVTLAAALQAGLVQLDTPAECPGEVFIDGVRIVNNNEPPGRRTQTVADAYAFSCNTFFAQLGVEVGEERLRETAEALGLTSEVPFPLPTSAGRLSTTPGFLDSDAGLAATGFGQGELQLSPLHLALLAATPVNGGSVPTPRLFLDDAPAPWRQALSPEAASALAEAMRYSVEAGWASTVAIPGVAIGGKTGSAEVVVEENPHALFIAFAESEGRSIAVAVIKEFAGSGSQQAGPVARAVIEAWLASEP